MKKIDINTILKSLGYKKPLSAKRQVVLSVLARASKPLSAADILKEPEIKKAALDRATVYRALSFFVKEKIAEVLYLKGDERLYHLDLEHHHHLLCTICQKIEIIPACAAICQEEKKLSKDTGFKIQGHILEFYGLCRDCAQRALVNKKK